MRILALETTEKIGSVAALDRNRLLGQASLDPQMRSAQSLAPAIRDLLIDVGWQPRDVELVAVPVGPGSFTGLRVGVTTAKTFAYAVGAEVLGVGTLETIAGRAPDEVAALRVVINAERQQVFATTLDRDEGGTFIAQHPPQILDNRAWLADLRPGDVVSGPALRKLASDIPQAVTAVDETLWPPTAAAVGQLAFRLYQSGRRDDVWKLVPNYYRKSAAEEKWDARHHGDKPSDEAS